MTGWSGDETLAATAAPLLGPAHPVAAVALVGPHGASTATIGTSTDADFEIGSLSKPITGMLYRDAVEHGRVAPTTVLGELLPLAGHGPVADLTLESLATHRSGLPRLPPRMQPVRRTWALWRHGANPYGDSLAELLEQVRHIRLGSTRGRYSNLGFQLLGHAVAAAAGARYADLLPGTFALDLWAPSTVAELRPTSLTGATGRGRPRDPWVGEGLAPAGGIRATIDTMSTLLARTLDGSAPGVSALDATTSLSPGIRIGSGWLTSAQHGRTITWHNGATGGFRSWMGLDRDAGVGVIVLSARNRFLDPAGFALLREHTAA